MTGGEIVAAVRGHLDEEGKLACAAAFQITQELSVEPLDVGQTADAEGARLNHCQLGLFGYGPKAEGRHKIVEPAAEVSSGLAQAIRDGVQRGKLSCAVAWEIASMLGVSRMEVSAAAEALGVRIFECQLGAF